MNKEFYINNRKKYFNLIKDNSITILSSGTMYNCSADEDYEFEVDKNFYYLTGINQAEVILVLVKEHNEVKEYLFLEKNDPIKVKWVGAKLEKDEAMALSGIKNICYYSEYDKVLHELTNNKLLSMYLQLNPKDNHRYFHNHAFSKAFQKQFKDFEALDCYFLIVGLKSQKEKAEVEKIKESIAITKEGLEEIMKHSHPGMFEYQLEAYFDKYIKDHGQRRTSFKTIAAGGINATTLHYTLNNSILNDNELVLFDLGTETEFYISDISRTFPVNGKFTERQREVYEEVLHVNKECIKFLKAGITKTEYNEYAVKLLTKACYKLGLISKDEDVVKYYFHSIGHSIGLDTHDPCIYDPYLREGMLVTVEPGLYIPEEKIGIRIEDDVLITKDNAINLSKDIIKEVKDIEDFFKVNNPRK